MEFSLPSPLSELLASESLKETEEAPAETNLLQLPAPSLTLTSLQLHSVVASLSSRQKSLQQKELDRTASTAEDELTLLQQTALGAAYASARRGHARAFSLQERSFADNRQQRRAYSRKSLRQLTPSRLNTNSARRRPASLSFHLRSFALPIFGSTQPENARRELLCFPWISWTLSGTKLYRHQVFKQLYEQQFQEQLWKQFFQQNLPVYQQQLFRNQELSVQQQQQLFAV